MKRKSKILIGCAVIFIVLVIALILARKQFVGGPGSSTIDGSRAVTDGGVKVPHWLGAIDRAEQKAGMTINDARIDQEGNALHIKTGPATSYWRSDSKAAGDFTVRATFNEPKYMNLSSHAHPYGIFIGGNDMATSEQSELYCAAFGNGRFIVRGFAPASFKMNGMLGEKNDAVHKAAGRGQPVTQDISLAVKGSTVSCTINGTVVASYNRASLTGPGKLKSTDGSYGIRAAHNTDIFVTDLAVSTD